MEATVNSILSEWRDVRPGVADDGPCPTPNRRKRAAEGDDVPGATVTKDAGPDRLSRPRPPLHAAAASTTAANAAAPADRSGPAPLCHARISNTAHPSSQSIGHQWLGANPYNRTGNGPSPRPSRTFCLSLPPPRAAPKSVQQEDEADAVHLPGVFFGARRRRLS